MGEKHFTSRKKLENEKRKFCCRLEENRKRFESSHNITRLLDFVLQEAALHIEEEQPLPDVETSVNLPLTVCRVTAVDGVAEGVNALRVGKPATAWRDGRHLVLEAAAGLRQLRVCYRRYTALAPLDPLPPFYVSGDATITVSPVILRLVLVLESPFRVRLRRLEVSEMGPLEVDLTGLGDWNFLWRISRWFVLPRVKRELRNQIELQAKSIVEEVLQRVNSMAADIPTFKVLLALNFKPNLRQQLLLFAYNRIENSSASNSHLSFCDG
ncbi:uncharacterized protein GBIM_17626 [Gryllus bimaculatus]|nr:uncharacterized protein GBIM_17626 [Gryllus bimaculatus]